MNVITSTDTQLSTLFKLTNFTLLEQKLEWRKDAEPLFKELFSDCDNAFWLDSNMAILGLSRYSFMGTADGPFSRVITYHSSSDTLVIRSSDKGEQTLTEDLFRFMSNSLDMISVKTENDYSFPFSGGFCGYFGYELKRQSCRTFAYESEQPDSAWMFVDRFVAIDHETGQLSICALADAADPLSHENAQEWIATVRSLIVAQQTHPYSEPTQVDVPKGSGQPVFDIRDDKKTYLANIERSLDLIEQGESYEICLTNRISTQVDVDPYRIYSTLRQRNPAPYSAFLRFEGLAISSSSPERFLKIDKDRTVESKPIKGTSKRGSNPEEDLRIADELANDEKSQAENLMIVDLLRNDLGRVCETGSVHVPKLMKVETYKTVHQLVSTVRGKLANDVSVVECVKSCFPGGSMTGAPKLRTLDIIDQLEGEARGIYSGSIGYLSLSGECDLNIVIRTIVSQDGHHSIGCGGALIALSDAEAEFEEILLKAKAPMSAIVMASTGKEAEAFHWKDADQVNFESPSVEHLEHSLSRAVSSDANAVTNSVFNLLSELGGPPPFFDANLAKASCLKLIEKPDLGFVTVAKDKTDKIVGIFSVSYCCATRTSKPYGIIQEAWVEGSFRGASVGQDMMVYARDLAASDGIEILEVSIPDHKHASQPAIARFYEKCGFKAAGQRLRLYV